MRPQLAKQAAAAHEPVMLSEIEDSLERLFPTLAVRPLRELDVGFGSVVVETADGVVFRVARSVETAAGHRLETALLPALVDWLPAAVPVPEWHVEPGRGGLAFGAIGYPKLAGETLSPDLVGVRSAGLAAELAEFFRRLHAFPVTEAERLGVPRARTWQATVDGARRVLPLLAERLTAGECGVLAAWCDEAAADDVMRRAIPALRHGDPWYGNVLVFDEPPRLAGVLDWEGARLGDPAADLAAQFHLGDAFAAAILEEYAADGNLRHRVRRFWEIREFPDRTTHLNDPAELDESVEKLRAGPILRRSRPRAG